MTTKKKISRDYERELPPEKQALIRTLMAEKPSPANYNKAKTVRSACQLRDNKAVYRTTAGRIPVVRAKLAEHLVELENLLKLEAVLADLLAEQERQGKDLEQWTTAEALRTIAAAQKAQDDKRSIKRGAKPAVVQAPPKRRSPPREHLPQEDVEDKSSDDDDDEQTFGTTGEGKGGGDQAFGSRYQAHGEAGSRIRRRRDE